MQLIRTEDVPVLWAAFIHRPRKRQNFIAVAVECGEQRGLVAILAGIQFGEYHIVDLEDNLAGIVVTPEIDAMPGFVVDPGRIWKVDQHLRFCHLFTATRIPPFASIYVKASVHLTTLFFPVDFGLLLSSDAYSLLRSVVALLCRRDLINLGFRLHVRTQKV